MENLDPAEFDLFVKIYNLGGAIWFLNHELADGRMSETADVHELLKTLQTEIHSAIEQTSAYGVVDPLSGNDSYWAWYNKCKPHWEALSEEDQISHTRRVNAK